MGSDLAIGKSGGLVRSPSRAEVRELLARLLHEIARIPGARIVDTAALDSDLRMESVALIEIQVAIEDRFDIELDVLEVVELNQFGAIVDYVYDRVRQVWPSKANA